MGRSVFERECNKTRNCKGNIRISIYIYVIKHRAFDGTLNELSKSLLIVPNGQKLDFIWRSADSPKNLINPIKVSAEFSRIRKEHKTRSSKMRTLNLRGPNEN
jgi:hypothetical protein